MALAKDQGINRALGKTPVSGTALDFQSFFNSMEFPLYAPDFALSGIEGKLFIFLLMD